MSDNLESMILLSADNAQPVSHHNLVLPALSCEIHQNKMIVMTGLHPSHITPYIKMLAGVNTPESGEVTLLKQSTVNLSLLEQQTLRVKAGFVLQGGPLLSVINGKQNLNLAARFHGIGDEQFIDDKADQLLSEIPDPDDHLLLPAYMSRVLRRHIAIARPLMLDPQILFIDNPFDGLGYHDQELVAEYMTNIVHHRGITLVVSSDDLSFTRQYADQIIFCAEDGALAFENWPGVCKSKQPSIMTFLKQPITTNA